MDASPADQEAVLENFNEYLSQLRQSDPEEFEALMQSMVAARAAEAQQAEGGAPPMSEEDAQRMLDDLQRNMPGGEGFVPRAPDGQVMGADGLAAADEGVDVLPEPGFVIKTARVDDEGAGAKVFINVCGCEQVSEPAKKVQLDENGEEQEGMNIPLSLGPPHPDTDKSGNECLVFDVIVHPKVLEECDGDATGGYRSFVCQLAATYVQQKHKVQVSDRFKLPKMRYKGPSPCRRQRIRKRRAPTIEEVAPGARKPAAAAAARAKAPKRALQPVAYELSQRAQGATEFEPCPDEAEPGDESDPPVEYLLVARLPELRDPASLEVELNAQLVAVVAEGYRALEVLLAHPVDVAAAESVFHADERRLELRLVTCELAHEGPDPGSNAWLLAQALADEERDAAEAEAARARGEAEAAVDPFHLRAPAAAAASSSTGIRPSGPSTMADVPVEDDEELPEDRFHRSDLLSQHILEQKRQQIQDKRDQAKRDREEMDNDPNITVERIGYDDEGKETKETEVISLPPPPSGLGAEEDGAEADFTEEERAANRAAAEAWTAQSETPMSSTLAFELL